MDIMNHINNFLFLPTFSLIKNRRSLGNLINFSQIWGEMNNLYKGEIFPTYSMKLSGGRQLYLKWNSFLSQFSELHLLSSHHDSQPEDWKLYGPAVYNRLQLWKHACRSLNQEQILQWKKMGWVRLEDCCWYGSEIHRSHHPNLFR